MDQKNKKLLFYSIMGLLAIGPFFVVLSTAESPIDLEKTRKQNMRTFCAYGREWVEFANGNATWGAMVLDYEGKPVRCNTILEPRFTKG